MSEPGATPAGGEPGSLEELRDRLGRATEELTRDAARREAEHDIGQLLVEAQRFTDAALADADQRARHTLAEAEAEAAAVLSEARHEADRIVAEARAVSPVPPETARELRAVIEGFTRVNAELVRELDALSQILRPLADGRSGRR